MMIKSYLYFMTRSTTDEMQILIFSQKSIYYKNMAPVWKFKHTCSLQWGYLPSDDTVQRESAVPGPAAILNLLSAVGEMWGGLFFTDIRVLQPDTVPFHCTWKGLSER